MKDNIPETTAMPENSGPSMGIQQPEPQQEYQEAQPQEQRPAKKYEYNEAQKNLQAMRQKAEQAERERDAAMKRLQEIEQQSEEFTLGNDDIAEGKHLKKIHQKISSEIKSLKEELYNYRQQSTAATTEARIKATYQDFDSIVTADNLAALRDSHPELASTLQSSPDLYSQAVSAYTMIKRLGIAADKQYEGDRDKAKANAYKPRPTNAVSPQQGDNPLTRANAFADGLTDDLKEQLRKEMYSSMKNY
jgi:chromosome segregation ATPase